MDDHTQKATAQNGRLLNINRSRNVPIHRDRNVFAIY